MGHAAGQLIGYLFLRPGLEQPLSLKLQPWGAVTGRLVTDDGKPWAGGSITTDGGVVRGFGLVGWNRLRDLVTDRDGAFQLAGIIPGLEYQIQFRELKPNGASGMVADRVTLTPGETRDLGTVRGQPLRRR